MTGDLTEETEKMTERIREMEITVKSLCISDIIEGQERGKKKKEPRNIWKIRV